MILFRLFSFFLRLLGAFVFVFILQIRFDGKTLEERLVPFGKKFVGTRVLNQVSEDAVRTLRHVTGERGSSRKVAGKSLKNLKNQFQWPEISPLKEKNPSSKEKN